MSKKIPVDPTGFSPTGWDSSYIPIWVPERQRLYAKGWSLFSAPQHVLTTTDGYHWEILTDSAPWGFFVWSAKLGVFVVIDGDNEIAARSTDCITWETQSISSFTLASIAAYGSLVWAPGLEIFALAVQEGVAYSTNGLDWHAGTLDGEAFSDYAGMFVVAHGSNRLVAGDGFGNLYTSTDGKDWTLTLNWDDVISPPVGEDTSVQNIAWSPTLGFLASGYNTANYRMAVSTDGVSWNIYTPPPGVALRIMWSSGLNAFVGLNGDACMSTDGYTWSTRPTTYGAELLDWFPPLKCRLSPVPYGYSSRVLVSPDGLNYHYLYWPQSQYLRMSQRTDHRGITRKPPALGAGRGSASAADTSGAPRVGQSNRYR